MKHSLPLDIALEIGAEVINSDDQKALLVPQMTVQLSHCRNPDIQAGGYWQEPVESGKKQIVPVASYAEAQRVCCDFIRRNHLGGGNWSGGQIRVNSKQIAHVSYNGRIWKGEGKQWTTKTEEIIP